MQLSSSAATVQVAHSLVIAMDKQKVELGKKCQDEFALHQRPLALDSCNQLHFQAVSCTVPVEVNLVQVPYALVNEWRPAALH